jgi:hypothetical protein
MFSFHLPLHTLPHGSLIAATLDLDQGIRRRFLTEFESVSELLTNLQT